VQDAPGLSFRGDGATTYRLLPLSRNLRASEPTASASRQENGGPYRSLFESKDEDSSGHTDRENTDRTYRV
jgi:hypothetical protein